MTAQFTLPAADAPAEEWGRLAVSIPGWRWMPGMRGVRDDGSGDRIMDCSESALPNHDIAPDPDDPATAGCLLRLLGPCEVGYDDTDPECGPWSVEIPGVFRMGPTLGRACIAAAAALGRWPGGAP